MAIVDPQLSMQGWGTSNQQILDNTFARFFVSEAAQSNTFHGRIGSMSYLVATFGNNPVTMAQETKIALERLFGRIVDVVEANVEVINFQPNGSDSNSRYGLKITVETVLNGQRRNLLENLEVGDTTFKAVKEFMNNGN